LAARPPQAAADVKNPIFTRELQAFDNALQFRILSLFKSGVGRAEQRGGINSSWRRARADRIHCRDRNEASMLRRLPPAPRIGFGAMGQPINKL